MALTLSEGFGFNSNLNATKTIKLMDGLVEVTDITDQYSARFANRMNLEIPTKAAIEGAQQSVEANADANGINQDLLIVDKMINLGEKIWSLVQKGKPLVNYTGTSASALPANTKKWDQLNNWKVPKSKVIRVVYKNLLNVEVARFSYRILLLYGGNVNGIGSYIGYATVEPLEIASSYMYSIDAHASVASVFNMGSKYKPVGAMILNITWAVESVFKKIIINHAYNLDGEGNITELGNAEIATFSFINK